MSKKIRWGILSTAKIGRTQVIPAIQKSELGEVAAIASNDKAKAEQTAADLGIPKAYSSYAELLAAADIDAVYIPLPNNLHVDYTVKALAAGKHVLCEKPIGLNTADALRLIDGAKQYPHLKVMEAFMYRFHPQWQRAKQIIAEDLLGEVKQVQVFFSYYNVDAGNIRNKPEAGGGALMDIGCYCVSFPRYVFGCEPGRVVGLINTDPVFKTDNLTSGLLDFGDGRQASFTCSTQLEPYQRLNIFGSKGRLEMEIPVNAPNDAPCRLWLQRDKVIEEIQTPAVNQYTHQVDAFAKAILDDTPVPTPLTDALGNMQAIDALFKSAKTGVWVTF
jgi:predicted dehydrogenase